MQSGCLICLHLALFSARCRNHAMPSKKLNLLRVHLPQHRQLQFRHESEALAVNIRHSVFKRLPLFGVDEFRAGWACAPRAE